MDRRYAALIGGTALCIAAGLYLPSLLTASWVYWEAATPLWTIEAPAMGTRIVPWLVYSVFSSPSSIQVSHFVLHLAVAGLFAAFVHVACRLSWPWAATGGALLLLNPGAVEAVRHGTGGADLCVALGVMTACLAAVQRRWGWTLVGISVALLSKESGIVVLGLVPLVVACRGRMSWSWWRWYGVGAALVTMLLLQWRFPHTTFAGLVYADSYSPDITMGHWIAVQMTATLRLMTTAITGIGMTADFDYDSVTAFWRLASVGALVGLGGVAWGVRRSWPIVSLGVGWILIASAPRWIVQTQTAFYTEYQFYVALIGVVLLVLGVLSPRPSAPCARG